jgi:hypothetical protein
MNQRLSDTPEGEASSSQDSFASKPRKPTRRKKDASSETPHADEQTARSEPSASIEASPAKSSAKRPRAKSAKSATGAKRRKTMNNEPVADLTTQGFSAVEIERLLEVSARAALSTEARESEAVMNRLRFTRWLVERGVINEFAV